MDSGETVIVVWNRAGLQLVHTFDARLNIFTSYCSSLALPRELLGDNSWTMLVVEFLVDEVRSGRRVSSGVVPACVL